MNNLIFESSAKALEGAANGKPARKDVPEIFQEAF